MFYTCIENPVAVEVSGVFRNNESGNTSPAFKRGQGLGEGIFDFVEDDSALFDMDGGGSCSDGGGSHQRQDDSGSRYTHLGM